MTIKELGYSIIDNSNDKYAKSKYILMKGDEVVSYGHKIYPMLKHIIICRMSDDEHLTYVDAQNPFRVRMTHFLNKITLNEAQREYIENKVFYDVYLKKETLIKKHYGNTLRKLKCVEQFKQYRNNMIKFMDVHVYFLKINNI